MVQDYKRRCSIQNFRPFIPKERSHTLKNKKLIKLKRAILNTKKVKIFPQIFSKKNFVKTMHRKHFDYLSCVHNGIYPMRPQHFEISYRLMINIFLFSPQKLSLLSPSSGYFL